MKVNIQENGLKGQHNLAQGKRSGALGWKANRKIVRVVMFIKEKIDSITFGAGKMTQTFSGAEHR